MRTPPRRSSKAPPCSRWGPASAMPSPPRAMRRSWSCSAATRRRESASGRDAQAEGVLIRLAQDARAVVALASESPYPGISVRAPALDEDDVRKPTAFPHTRATADRGLPLVTPTIGGVLFEELAVRRNTKTLRADGVRAMGSLGREGVGHGPDLRAPEQRPIEDDLDED